jgi:hypothetical protein
MDGDEGSGMREGEEVGRRSHVGEVVFVRRRILEGEVLMKMDRKNTNMCDFSDGLQTCPISYRDIVILFVSIIIHVSIAQYILPLIQNK